MTDEVTRHFSGAPWETKVGYCRALRVGNQIYVTGTAPVDAEGKVMFPDDAYQQARRCLEIIDQAVHSLAVGTTTVVRTRMYVTNIDQWPQIGDAHREWFKGQPPATTMEEVKRLIEPQMINEVEADVLVM